MTKLNLDSDNVKSLIAAIDRYLAKADANLTDELRDEGLPKPRETVERSNELEKLIQDEFERERKQIQRVLEAQGVAEALNQVDDILATTPKAYVDTLRDNLKAAVMSFATAHIQSVDKELTILQLTKRTSDWIDEWSAELVKVLRVASVEAASRELSRGLTDGKGVKEVARMLRECRDFDYKRSHRTALTEMLTAHSAASLEAARQNPAVDKIEWLHTGSHKNNPRRNHVAMNRQRVNVGETFRMVGSKDGKILHPTMPRDPQLPPEERINCHCVLGQVVSKDVLGMDIKERRRRQWEIIREDDGEWERELDARNREKAGIDQEPVALKHLKGSREDKIKALGGSHPGKVRLALLETGIVPDGGGRILTNYTYSETRGRYEYSFKSLKELPQSGIIPIERSRMVHTLYGEYTKSGRHDGGGHTQAALEEMKKHGVEFVQDKVLPNGVIIGHIPNSKQKRRTQPGGHTIFPSHWTDEDIIAAGLKAANTPSRTNNYQCFTEYKGIEVCATVGEDRKIGTIYPVGEERE